MSQQTAQGRSWPDKPGGCSAPRGRNGAMFGLLGLPPALRTGWTGPGQPPEPGKEPEKRVRSRAWRCTMALHGPAAEQGKVIWEMSAYGFGGGRMIADHIPTA
jgi:hypothetical protein